MLKKIANKAKRGLTTPKDPDLDLNFYRNTYSDLTGFSARKLYEHWFYYGRIEGRLPNGRALNEETSQDFDLDPNFYLYYYPDLQVANITTLKEAKLHWLRYGKEEGRYRTAKEWIEKNNHHQFSDPSTYNYPFILEANKEVNVTFKDLIELSIGKLSKVIRLYADDKMNSNFYRDLGINCYKHYKLTSDPQHVESALTAWQTSLYFCKTAEVIELIGNLYFDKDDYRTAQKVYENALEIANTFNINLVQNLLLCYEKLTKVRRAVNMLTKLQNQYPEVSLIKELLFQSVEKLYSNFLAGIQVLSVLGEINKMTARVQECSSLAYTAFYGSFTKQAEDGMQLKPHLNTDKVLIIGDYHVPQCIRYRIDQKIEQLESQGKIVTAIDWTKLSEHQNEISLHDVVIFYRVPAVPQVLKAMAQVNANGKASFYEIDDLLFEESYPAPLETFGGYIGLDTHIELRKSMASFKAAASFCRFGISSTQLLCDKLEQLVMDKKCILHRNGLDKLNVIRHYDKTNKSTIDIFYGSGTQAHNSDFIEQALPALEKILDKYKNARLIIAGYLQLPLEFTKKYKHQLQQLPPVTNVKAYWSFLERADINLAVLKDDEINGCKSELKWFEAACFGIPSVLSATANYRDVINQGDDAFIAGNETEWLEALEALIVSPDLRKSMADKALKRIQTEYSVEVLGAQLTVNLDNLLKIDKPVKKKIALVNVFFPPQAIGGATRVLADNFDVLQKQYGDDFELVVFTSDDHCTAPYQLNTYQHQGVTVYRSTILYRENMDWHPKDPKMYKLFEQFLETERPDLVHFHCVQRLTASVVEATKDMGIPYMVTAHDAWWISDHQFLIDADDNVYPEGHCDIYAPRTLPHNVTLGDSIERIMYFQELLSSATKVLTVSESFADIYRKNGYPKIEVNKNGISTTIEWAEKQTSYTDKVVCGHIGGMANHKGYFLLKEAIEKEQPHNIEMLIVDHSKPEGFEQKTMWGAVPVTFIGRVNQIGITKLYQKIDVLFAPSLWPESYGLVTREAAASGCWVVASNLGGIGEDIIEGETGMRIKPDISDLIRVLKEIDCNANKFKQNIKQTEIRVASKQVEELVEIYK